MQLIVILLATVSILTLLSGAIVFFGSSKKDRIRSAWYFIAAIFATVWMASISIFLVAKPEDMDSIVWHVNWTFVSAILLDVAFLGYGAWNKKYGKITTAIFLALGLLVGGTILLNPSALYSEVVLSNSGNSVTMNIGLLYFCYIAFFGAIVPVIVGVFAHQYFKTKSQSKRGGDIVTMGSFGISSTIVLVVIVAEGNGFVFFFGQTVGIFVNKHEEVIKGFAVIVVIGVDQNNIIVGAAFVFVKTNVGTGPIDIVGGFHHTNDTGTYCPVGIGAGSNVIHPVDVAVFYCHGVSNACCFPGSIKGKCKFFFHRVMQF